MRVWRRDYYLIWVDLFFVLKWFKLSYKIPRPLLLPLSPNVWKPESFFLFPEKIFKTLFFYLFQVCFTSQLQYSSLCYRGLCKERFLLVFSSAAVWLRSVEIYCEGVWFVRLFVEKFAVKEIKEKLICIPLISVTIGFPDYKREENDRDSPLCLILGSSR